MAKRKCLYGEVQTSSTGRRLAGRCLGHGTVFKDQKGQWWCTDGDVTVKTLDPEYVNPGKEENQKFQL